MLALAFWRIAFVVDREPAADDQHLYTVDGIRATASMANRTGSCAVASRKGLDPGERRKGKDLNIIVRRMIPKAITSVEVTIYCQLILLGIACFSEVDQRYVS